MTLYDLVQLMQRIKNTGRPLSTTTHPKLTPSDQQAIPIGGTGTASNITLSDLQTMVGTSTLIPGQYYLVSGCNVSLYGGTTLLLQAVTDNVVSSVGLGKFYNPKYDTYSVYDPNGTYEQGDVVIYGGSVWVNASGNLGSVTDNFNLSNDWTGQLIPNSTYYYEVWDAIEYNYANDYITSRYDAVNNNIVATSYATSYWFWCAVQPIQMFRWGHAYNGTSGVQDCRIINSYINNLNFVSGYMIGIDMNNFSYAYDITMVDNSYIQGLTMNNSSQIQTLQLDGSGLYSVRIDNGAELQNVSLTSSSMFQIVIDNGAAIYDLSVSNCTIDTVSVTDLSIWSQFTLTNNAYLYNMNFANYSWVSNMSLSGTDIYTLLLNNSGFGDGTLVGGYIADMNMFDGGFYNIDASNCTFLNQIINGFNLDFTGYEIVTGMGSLSASIFQFGTIVYQFYVNFNGAAGQGAIGVYNLQLLPVPNGFFIEKVIVDGSNGSLTMSDGATDCCINLGIAGGNTTSGINDTTGLMSAMTVPQVFDLSNGKVTASLATANTWLQLAVSGTNDAWGSIIGGNMRFEVTLKNINYSTSND